MTLRSVLLLGPLWWACSSAPPEPGLAIRSQALFSGGGFEQGAPSGAQAGVALNGGLTLPVLGLEELHLLPGGVDRTQALESSAGEETMTPAGLSVDDSLSWPKYGNGCGVINEGGNLQNVNSLTLSTVVAPEDVDPVDGQVHVRFVFAPVLQNPVDHAAEEQPYLYLTLRNKTRQQPLWSLFQYSNQSGLPWKSAVLAPDVKYTDWQSVDVAPDDARLSIGDEVELVAVAAGCSRGGHWGQMYLDGLGAFLPGVSIVASAPQETAAGAELTYSYLARNEGASTAASTTAHLKLPEGTAYLSSEVPGGSCTPSGSDARDVVCSLGSLEPSERRTFQLTVQVDPNAAGKLAHGDYFLSTGPRNSPLGPLVESTLVPALIISTRTQGPGGTFTCPTVVPKGHVLSCGLTLAPGAALAVLTDNGVDVTRSVVAEGTYSPGSIQEPHTLVATFKQLQGGACTQAEQCLTGNCVDGVCCNSACNGQCEACDVAGSEGTCRPVDGAPRGSRPVCVSDSSVCGGTCNGVERGACVYPSAAEQCRAASCQDAVASPAAACDGAGSCAALPSQSCGLYVCGADACLTACQVEADCEAPARCLGGQCQLGDERERWKALGSGCSSTGGGASVWLVVLVTLAVLLRRRRAGAWLACAGVLALPVAARAQAPEDRSLLIERLRPPPGRFDVLGVASAQVPAAFSSNVRLFVSYAEQPLRLTSTVEPSSQLALVRGQTSLILTGSVAVPGRLELGIAVPVVLHQNLQASGGAGEPVQGEASGAVLSDLSLSAKAQVLRTERFALALALPIRVPTGARNAYAGGQGFSLAPLASAELQGPRGLRVMGNLGVSVARSRQVLNLRLGTALTYGLGGELELGQGCNLALLGALTGETGLAQPSPETRPLELQLGVRWGFLRGLELMLGGGPGLTQGYGTPRYRLMAAVGFIPGSRSW